jgi:hypothetical protein
MHFAVPPCVEPVQQLHFLGGEIDAGDTHRFEAELMSPRLYARRERSPIARIRITCIVRACQR